MRTEEINRKRRQKPIDTLQIAAALDFIGDDVVLVSSDPDLNKGAELEGIKVCNPEDIEEKGAPIP